MATEDCKFVLQREKQESCKHGQEEKGVLTEGCKKGGDRIRVQPWGAFQERIESNGVIQQQALVRQHDAFANEQRKWSGAFLAAGDGILHAGRAHFGL